MRALPPRAMNVLARSLLLQAAWNFRRFQNVGWAYCLEPALGALYPDPGRRAAALRRHLELFNTHPVMAPCLAGALLKAEAKMAESAPDPGQEAAAAALKAGLMAPFAGLGDAFFWSGLRPLAGLMAAGWAWLGPAKLAPWAPLVLLALYNPAQLWLRVWGLRVGWREGLGVAARIQRLGLPRLVEGLRSAAFCLVAGLSVSLGRFAHPATGEGIPLLDNLLFVGSGFLMLMLLRLRVSALAVLGLAVAGGVLSALAAR